MSPRISRRTVLRGLLGGAAVSVALPTLEVFLNGSGTAYADGTALPRRFGLFFWGNGALPPRWVPEKAGVGDEWSLSPQLLPLAPIKHKVGVVTGTQVLTGNDVAHGAGSAGILTGAPVIARGDGGWTLRRPTVDQVLATAIGGETRFRSIEVAAQENGQGQSFRGPDQRNPPEWSPIRLYERLFGPDFQAPGDEPIIDPKLALRRSVLDAVMDDSRALSLRVGAVDRARLEQHFSAVRDLEQRLQRLQEDPPDLASCARPNEPAASYPPIDARPQLAEINTAMSDIMAMALACDQTRVLSYWFTDSLSNLLFPGRQEGHHRLTHDEPGEQPEVDKIVTYIMTQFSALAQRLDAVPEGDGTLLDNCVLLGTTDCSLGRQHLLEEYPLVYAGSACGALKTGIHHRSPAGNENSSKLVLSILRAMGLPLASWGEEGGMVTSGLSGVEA